MSNRRVTTRIEKCRRPRKLPAIAWGPYLSDRQWGTVREDRTSCRDSWRSLNYDEACSGEFWNGEDGLFGICDPDCRLCFAHCFHNGKDDRVKERLFGLSGPEGNHGEDVKEVYFYRTNTPGHNFMTATYMYPMLAFPYDTLRKSNAERSANERELEIWDTACFADGWWEITITYTRLGKTAMVSEVRATNCSPSKAQLTIAPTVWFRNPGHSCDVRPCVKKVGEQEVMAEHPELGSLFLTVDRSPRFIFPRSRLSVSDLSAAPSADSGSRCLALLRLSVPPGESESVRCCLSRHRSICMPRLSSVQARVASVFYAQRLSWVPSSMSDLRQVLEFAYSGLLWCKQYYEYDVSCSNQVRRRQLGEEAVWNSRWEHFHAKTVMSMPDKWEFPWVPGCEYDFEDANPPVHGLAILKVFEQTKDWNFLANVFPRLRLNLQWWWNQRQTLDRNDDFADGLYFSAGFLGLDNICVLDRSKPPAGYRFFQCDAFSWVFLLALNCLEIGLLLYERRQVDWSVLEELVEMLASMQRGFRHLHSGLGCDLLLSPSSHLQHLPIASYVALTPLLACRLLPLSPALRRLLPRLRHSESGQRAVLISLLPPDARESLLTSMLALDAFVGPFGVRSLSKQHETDPVEVEVGGERLRMRYCPGESDGRMFGGNSNWRGPVWIPINFLLIDALRTLSQAQPKLLVSFLGQKESLDRAWRIIGWKILSIFLMGKDRQRPVHGDAALFNGPWSGPECILFYEFFHGDTGRGCGASHQTGWTALITTIAKMLFSTNC